MNRSATALALLLGALPLVLGACRDDAGAARAPVAPPSWDDRERAALEGVGRSIPDIQRHDTGVHISDVQAALFDEELCEQACGHLFDLLAREQRANLADDPAALEVFLKDLAKMRERRLKTCVADCRRYADLPMVECVHAAEDRASLDRCDF